jgi:prophage tail gpP-like protein
MSGAASDSAPNRTPIDNTVVLTVAGQTLTGWVSVRVTRSIERFPSDFDIALTERNPGDVSGAWFGSAAVAGSHRALGR